jgi:hypothetical protein
MNRTDLSYFLSLMLLTPLIPKILIFIKGIELPLNIANFHEPIIYLAIVLALAFTSNKFKGEWKNLGLAFLWAFCLQRITYLLHLNRYFFPDPSQSITKTGLLPALVYFITLGLTLYFMRLRDKGLILFLLFTFISYIISFKYIVYRF